MCHRVALPLDVLSARLRMGWPAATGGDSCVDGPSEARGWTRMTRSGCGHVSGLLARPMTAGPDEVRERAPNKLAASGAVESRGVLPLVGPTDRHLASLPFSRGTGARSGHRRRRAISCSTLHHGPHDAGHLVGQGDRRELARLALQQGQQPR